MPLRSPNAGSRQRQKPSNSAVITDTHLRKNASISLAITATAPWTLPPNATCADNQLPNVIAKPVNVAPQAYFTSNISKARLVMFTAMSEDIAARSASFFVVYVEVSTYKSQVYTFKSSVLSKALA